MFCESKKLEFRYSLAIRIVRSRVLPFPPSVGTPRKTNSRLNTENDTLRVLISSFLLYSCSFLLTVLQLAALLLPSLNLDSIFIIFCGSLLFIFY